MIDKVLNTIKNYNMLEKGDRVLVGLSGGPDSLALLHVLIGIKEMYDLHICAAHVNHSLRGQESDDDQRFVEEFCRSWGMPVYVLKVDIKEISKNNKISLEEAGRIARYQFFNNTLEKIDAQKIAVAHNANDNAETVLMRIIRGTGIEGLAGIKPVRDNIIRPLIEITREEIEEYCSVNQLSPRIDSSNKENKYTRNKIRLKLIPYLKDEFNKNIVDTVNRMSNLSSIDNKIINDLISNILQEIIISQNEEYIILNLDKINKQPKYIIPKLIRKAIYLIKGDLVEIEYTNLEDTVKFIFQSKTGSMLHLPHNIKIKKSYNELIIYKNYIKKNGNKYNYPLIIPGITNICEGEFKIESYLEDTKSQTNTNKYIQVFDYDLIKEGLFIRTRKEGDLITPKGMKGTKKLKDYFIDKKVPKDDRDSIPIVSKGNEIIWIVGYCINDKYKVNENTKNKLVLKYVL